MSNSSTAITVTITTPEGKEFTLTSSEYTFLTATIGQVYFATDRGALKEIEQALKDERQLHG
jgi:hypothetical protein